MNERPVIGLRPSSAEAHLTRKFRWPGNPPQLCCSAKTIPCDDTRHLAITADYTIGLPRRHALGAGIDEGLKFRFETGFPGPSVICKAFDREHLENSITLWR